MGGDYEFPSDSEGEEDGDVAVASSTAAEASGGPSESTTVGAVEEGKSDGKPRSDSDLARELQSQWNA